LPDERNGGSWWASDWAWWIGVSLRSYFLEGMGMSFDPCSCLVADDACSSCEADVACSFLAADGTSSFLAADNACFLWEAETS